MPTTEPRRLNPGLLWGIFLAIIALVFIVVRSTTRDLIDVRVAAVSRQNIVSTVSTNGKVEPIEEFQAYAPAPGVVAKVYVEVGQKIRTGELLIKMDDADAVSKLASANATLKAAEINLQNLEQGGTQEERISLSGELAHAKMQQEQAVKDVASLKQLQQKGAASASEITAAEQRLQSANTSLENIQMR